MAKTIFARPPVRGPIVIPNANMVILRWQNGGHAFSNVFFCNNTAAGPLNPGVAETVFSALKAAAATTTWLTFVSTTASFTGVWVKDVRAGNNPMLRSTGAAALGTSTGVAIPASNAMVITLNTAFSGRGFRGRIYLGGLATNVPSGPLQVQGAASTAGINFINQVNTTVTANLGPLIVAQRALNASTHPDAPPPYNQARPANGSLLVQQVVNVNLRMDSQRRRLGR